MVVGAVGGEQAVADDDTNAVIARAARDDVGPLDEGLPGGRGIEDQPGTLAGQRHVDGTAARSPGDVVEHREGAGALDDAAQPRRAQQRNFGGPVRHEAIVTSPTDLR